eukprot:11255-Heterococcus_DN1.PRE.3
MNTRWVLIGPAGSGKSYTGNVLVGCPNAFEVSDKAECCTAVVQGLRGVHDDWNVVDTPGLGGVRHQLENESDEEYATARILRRLEIFDDITDTLRRHGGSILYVTRVSRGTDTHNKHLQAVDEAICKKSCTTMLLVLTGIPPKYLYNQKATPAEKAKKLAAHEAWLATHRLKTEAGSGVNKEKFIDYLRGIATTQPSLAPYATHLWSKLIAGLYTSAETVKTLEAAKQQTEKDLRLARAGPSLLATLLFPPVLLFKGFLYDTQATIDELNHDLERLEQGIQM